MRHVIWSVVILLLSMTPAIAQQELRSSTKGASTPLPITGSSIDADHNALDVKCLSGCTGGAGGGGTSATDDAAFAPGTDAVTPAGFMFDDVALNSVHEGDIGVGRMSANRNLYGTIRDAAGNERGANVNSSNELLTNANTELPAAAALADTTSNPTVPGVGSYNMCWNGSTWDRCTKATAGNGAVDTATQRVTIANDSTGNLATIGTSITPGTSAAHLGKAEDGAHTTGDTGVMLLGVRAASPTDRSAGPTDGDYEPLGINAAGAVWTTPTPTTAGGLTTHYLTSAASTNSTNVKNAAGQVYLIRAVNTTSTLYYLRMYNASAAPTCSSATNFVETIPIPASASGAGIVIPQYMGQTYATGISYCLTGGGSSTDNTNAATGVYLTILYK